MSYIIYGADVSGIVRNKTNIISYLESKEFKCNNPDVYDNWQENKKDNPSLSFWEWVSNWDNGIEVGFSGFLANIINKEFHLDLTGDGYYVGIGLDLPWMFSDKMLHLTEKQFHTVIQDKLCFFTGEVKWGFFTVNE